MEAAAFTMRKKILPSVSAPKASPANRARRKTLVQNLKAYLVITMARVLLVQTIKKFVIIQ